MTRDEHLELVDHHNKLAGQSEVSGDRDLFWLHKRAAFHHARAAQECHPCKGVGVIEFSSEQWLPCDECHCNGWIPLENNDAEESGYTATTGLTNSGSSTLTVDRILHGRRCR